ncbi:hypothetical protein HDV57DRAFT_516606 [Trichoderma longibrachiatum]
MGTWTEDTKPIVHTNLPYPDKTTKPKKSTNPVKKLKTAPQINMPEGDLFTNQAGLLVEAQ